jgi:hypothetical protein
MRIETNEKLYKRNTRAALLANLTGLFLLAGSVYVLFGAPSQFGRYLLFLLGGVIFTQIGNYFGRWNKRPDHAINQALKSLDNSYTIYHFRSPVAHLLLGPSGIWILLPRYTRGTVTYDAKRRRWRARGGRLLGRLLQEGIGRPVQEASLEAEFLDSFFQKNWTGGELHVQAALVFVEPETEVQASEAPLLSVSVKKLKQVAIRGDSKGHLSREQIRQLNQLIESKY